MSLALCQRKRFGGRWSMTLAFMWLGWFSKSVCLSFFCILIFYVFRYGWSRLILQKKPKSAVSSTFEDNRVPFNALQSPLYEHMESAFWLNRIIAKFWEKLEPTWSDYLLIQLQNLAKQHQPSFIKEVLITHLTLGRQAPELHNLKCFRTAAVDCIILDSDLDWLARSSEIRVVATFLGIQPPLLSVRKIVIHAKVRLQIHLGDSNSLLGVDKLSISFVQQPQIELQIVPLASGLDMMDIPAFRSWLRHLLTVRAFESMLFPKMITVPIASLPNTNHQSSETNPSPHRVASFFSYKKNNSSYPPNTAGILTVRILSAQIAASEEGFQTEWNPSLTIRLDNQVMTTNTSYRTNQPIYEEKFEYYIQEQPSISFINVRLYHSANGLFEFFHALGRDYLLGSGWLPLDAVLQSTAKDMDIWLPLTASWWKKNQTNYTTVPFFSIGHVHMLLSYEACWDPTNTEADRRARLSIANESSRNEQSTSEEQPSLQGWIDIHLLEAYQLHHLNNPSQCLNDVRCILQWHHHQASTMSEMKDTCPIWKNTFFQFPVSNVMEEYLLLTIMDQDPFVEDSVLGKTIICIDNYGDIEPKEYWIPIEKEMNGIKQTTGWLRIWLTFRACLQDEMYYNWTRSGNYFIIQPSETYWKSRMHSFNNIQRDHYPLMTFKDSSFQLFEQLRNLEWKETTRLLTRRVPRSLWKWTNESISSIPWKPPGWSLLFSGNDSNELDTLQAMNITHDHQNEQSTQESIEQYKPWMIIFQTGDSWGAGTDATVWIQFWDENGHISERYYFSNANGSQFCRCGQDTFIILVPKEMQSPIKVQVGHNGKGLFPSWFLKTIYIRPAESHEEENWKSVFMSHQWITSQGQMIRLWPYSSPFPKDIFSINYSKIMNVSPISVKDLIVSDNTVCKESFPTWNHNKTNNDEAYISADEDCEDRPWEPQTDQPWKETIHNTSHKRYKISQEIRLLRQIGPDGNYYDCDCCVLPLGGWSTFWKQRDALQKFYSEAIHSHLEVIEEDTDEENELFGDTLICCEHCPQTFHFGCVCPPLLRKQVEEITSWLCTKCCQSSNEIVPKIRRPWQQLQLPLHITKTSQDNLEQQVSAMQWLLLPFIDSVQHTHKMNKNSKHSNFLFTDNNIFANLCESLRRRNTTEFTPQFVVLSAFDGIAAARLAWQQLGIHSIRYYASEIDTYTIHIANSRFPDIIQLGDIRHIQSSDIPEGIDFLIGGSPCQSLSRLGHQQGIQSGPSALFFEYVRLMKIFKPRYFLLENVASMNAQDKQIISESLGVEPILVDGSRFSAGIRYRYYWTNIPHYKKILNMPEKPNCYLQHVLVDHARAQYPKAYTITTNNYAPRVFDNRFNTVWYDDQQKRGLSIIEAERILGFPDDYTKPVESICTSPAQAFRTRWRCLGNSFCVPVIEAFCSFLKDAMATEENSYYCCSFLQ
eukprot:jgi/Galph1/4281/GphlegSOOS_G2927.1